jgi:membrane protein
VRERLRRAEGRAAERHPAWWRRVWAPGILVGQRIVSDAIGIQAGSLTYGAFLSIPPLLIVLLSIAGSLLRNDPEAAQKLLDTIAKAIPGMDQLLGSSITVGTAQQAGLGLIGAVFVIWAASGFAARVRNSFGLVFRTLRTGLVFGRVSAALLGTPIVLVFVLLAALGSLSAGLRIAGRIAWLSELATYAALGCATFVFAMMIYRLLTPGRGPTLRQHVPGSILFTVGWLLLHLLGAEYVNRVVTKTTALYGAIGVIFGLLAFLYLTMWWLLLCAEVTQARIDARARADAHEPKPPGKLTLDGGGTTPPASEGSSA